MRILGIDYGKKKTGVALGDTDSRVASPLAVWKESDIEKLISRVVTFAQEESVDVIVVGVPKKANGELTQQGKLSEEFIKNLGSRITTPVHKVDESFTSVEGQRLREEYGTDAEEDALAAMLILQEYFDSSS